MVNRNFDFGLREKDIVFSAADFEAPGHREVAAAILEKENYKSAIQGIFKDGIITWTLNRFVEEEEGTGKHLS